MQKTSYDITIFLITTSVLFFTLTAFIISIVNLYKRRQLQFEKNIAQIKIDYETMILSAQLEMQEETFRHISREIHDNISLSLTLAKLNLNTLNWKEPDSSNQKISNSIDLLSRSISELSDISKSLNADIIINHGLLRAVEDEISRIRQIGLFELNFRVIGTPMYLESKKELIVFRIIQEAFNNIIKHAGASIVGLALNYNNEALEVKINDNGRGFDINNKPNKREAGISNIKTRVQILNGSLKLISIPGKGTLLSFTIPIK